MTREWTIWLLGLTGGLFAASCGGGPLKAPERSLEDSGAPAADSAQPVDADGDGFVAAEDCDDRNPEVFPGADEVCNERDDDCDGETDEGLAVVFYRDADSDGFGDADAPVEDCAQPAGTAPEAGDCDDRNPDVFPGADEVCNEADDDCDGEIDEDVADTVYADADGDGWGDADLTASGCPRSGWVADPGDCDDSDPSANPGQLWDGCDGVDSDCDGDVDEDSKAGWELVTVDTNNGVTLAIDPATAALTSFAPVSTAENINTMDVNENGMAVVHVNTLEELALFDACTGAWTSIGAHGIGGIGGIAFGPSGRLFGIGGGDTLYEFDLTTAAATEIGPLGIDINTSGLAWDCTTQTLYGADGGQDVVFEVDVNTGAATNIRRTSVPFNAVGLEFDRVSGDLLASTADRLYTIDPTTGSSTYIGYFPGNHADDLAWHPTCP